MLAIAGLSSDEYFVPFGREPGSYLDVLGLGPSASVADANRALVAYKQRVDAEYQTACNEIRERFAAHAIGEAEQTDEIEKQTAIKTQKLTDLNTLKKRHDSQVAERRRRLTLGLPDDTATWQPMYRDLSDQSEATWNALLRPQVLESVSPDYAAQLSSRWLQGNMPWAIVPAGSHDQTYVDLLAGLSASGRQSPIPLSQAEAQVQQRVKAARKTLKEREQKGELTSEAARLEREALDADFQQQWVVVKQLHVQWHDLESTAQAQQQDAIDRIAGNPGKLNYHQTVQTWIAEYKALAEQLLQAKGSQRVVIARDYSVFSRQPIFIRPFPPMPPMRLSTGPKTAEDFAADKAYQEALAKYNKEVADFDSQEAKRQAADQEERQRREAVNAQQEFQLQAAQAKVQSLQNQLNDLQGKLQEAGLPVNELKALVSLSRPASVKLVATKLVAERCATADSVNLSQWLALTAERDLLPCLIADSLWSAVRYTDRSGWRKTLDEWNEEFAALGPNFSFKAGNDFPGWLNLSRSIAYQHRTVQHLADGDEAVVADAPDRSRAQADDTQAEMAELLRRFLAHMAQHQQETANE